MLYADDYQTVILEGMAQQFHLSTPYISKYIKEKSGKTFGEQVIAIRMKRAKTLLKNGNMTVENISHAVGYQNVENFSRQFKKNFQMTPDAVPQPEPCFLNLFKDFVISWKNRKKCVKLGTVKIRTEEE